MSHSDAQWERIETVTGNDEESSFGDYVDKFHVHLKGSLELPCDVTGIEDFRWEEIYVLGPGDPNEYERLCRDRPSYTDEFELLAIKADVQSEWMLFHDDLAAHVRRKSDSKKFYLGLSEIEAIDKKSKNNQLLFDYSVWFCNSR